MNQEKKQDKSNICCFFYLPTSLWWLEYLERVDKLKFNFKYKESDITRKRNWIENSVSKTQLQVILSQYDYE